MAKRSLPIILSNMKATMMKHSPEILTGVGIAGMITTTVLAVRATPKALLLIEEEKHQQDDIDKLRPIEVVKTTWTCYIPAAVTGSLSVVCLVGANSINLRRNAAIAAAYALSESTLKDYQEKVIETIGERKEKSIRDEVAKDTLERNPVTNNEVIVTGRGETLCFDAVSGRYFKSDIDKLKKAENELNRALRDEMYVSLNEFYYEIGLSGIEIGDDIGWNMDSGYIDLEFSSQLAEDGTPCLVIRYHIAPRYDYRSLH